MTIFDNIEKRRIRVITKLPHHTHKPRKPTVAVFQFPNGSYSLFIRKPTKTWCRSSEGMLIGRYWHIDKAKQAARKWLLAATRRWMGWRKTND